MSVVLVPLIVAAAVVVAGTGPSGAALAHAAYNVQRRCWFG
ncbi:hypothetical protein ACIBF6_08925 [Streptosporangium amethystogenes]